MAHLSAIQAFVLGFCSSGYDFAIASSRPHLTMRTLQVAIGFAGNCAPCGLSPQTNGMPVIPKKEGGVYHTVSGQFLKVDVTAQQLYLQIDDMLQSVLPYEQVDSKVPARLVIPLADILRINSDCFAALQSSFT